MADGPSCTGSGAGRPASHRAHLPLSAFLNTSVSQSCSVSLSFRYDGKEDVSAENLLKLAGCAHTFFFFFAAACST